MVDGCSDDLTFLLAIIGGVVGTVLITALVVGLIIWQVRSSSSRDETAPAQTAAPPAAVSQKPDAHTRYAPSQLYNSHGYGGGYDNSGYYGRDEYFGHSDHHHYPYQYRSRINVHSDQIPPFSSH